MLHIFSVFLNATSRIIIVLAEFMSFHCYHDLLELGRSEIFERPRLKCTHKFLTEAYYYQISRNVGSIRLYKSVYPIVSCYVCNCITTIASIVVTKPWDNRSGLKSILHRAPNKADYLRKPLVPH